ncbi:hypothetical protein BDZ85DRAFT_313042 [Elsinoe ampelina]|uniref:Uncharacterized protein n=1 Tax=Elsinoe ampelina TaxID=302913 RepID=A0A6A6FXF8_9PEZI|nr:hypothetical protein BDZ85DRAFT_313042 [Elsinoe ampelina]
MPRFGLLNPHDQDPERAQLVQAYMVLRSQQTSVQRRLSSPPPESPSSSAASSPETRPLDYDAEGDLTPVTPIRRRSSHTTSPSASPRTSHSQRSPYLRRPSVPSIPEMPDTETRIDTDSDKLDSINLKIKATLTDLLNCESVKSDERMRSWVQTRLMDAQQTLNERRRHSSGGAHRRVSSAVQGWGYPGMVMGGWRVEQLMEGEGVRKLSI